MVAWAGGAPADIVLAAVADDATVVPTLVVGGSGTARTITLTTGSTVNRQTSVRVTATAPGAGAATASIAVTTVATSAMRGTAILGSDVVVEERTGVARVSISRSQGSSGPLSARVVTQWGGASAADAAAIDRTVTWAAGQTQAQTIEIPLVSDGLAEPVESFRLRIVSQEDASYPSPRPEAVVTIRDNDAGSIASPRRCGASAKPLARPSSPCVAVVARWDRCRSPGAWPMDRRR
jgi:hypothetical protein